MGDAIIEKAIALTCEGTGSPRIGFFGGEPLLEWERMQRAVALARSLNGDSAQFYLVTNGTLLNEEVLRWIIAEQIHLTVSIDGCRRAHEVTRPFASGESSFDSVAENLERACGAIPEVETLSVIDPLNAAYLDESFTALLNLGGSRLSFTFNYSGAWMEPSFEILGDSLLRLGNAYIDAYRSGLKFSLDLFDSKIITHLNGGYACADRCNFGALEVGVAPSGNLHPCERLIGEDSGGALSIGHVDSGIDFAKLREMRREIDHMDDDCRRCSLLSRCIHWCGCVNLAATGSLGRPDGRVCRLEQMAIQFADRAAEILHREQNPIFVSRFYQSRDRKSQ